MSDNLFEQLDDHRVRLIEAMEAAGETTDHLHDLITYVRSLERVPVNQMATAIKRNRNYIDCIWCNRHKYRMPQGSWFGLSGDESQSVLLGALTGASDRQRKAVVGVKDVRAARDKVICEAYRQELGPVRIAGAVGLDRNQVLRVVRKAGIPPMHHNSTDGQYTQDADAA